MRTVLVVLGILLAAAASATTYKWVDRNGVTHYSDRPQPGAEIIELRSAQTFDAPTLATPGVRTTARNQQARTAVPYDQLDLWKPSNDEVFTNTGNTVPVRLRLEPDLQAGHTVWLYLDGKRVDGQPGNALSFDLTEVPRGTHTISAVVADVSGSPLIKSQTVTFHLRQPSALAPNRSPRPVRS
jgi:uncharacterized protein DUF4124